MIVSTKQDNLLRDMRREYTQKYRSMCREWARLRQKSSLRIAYHGRLLRFKRPSIHDVAADWSRWTPSAVHLDQVNSLWDTFFAQNACDQDELFDAKEVSLQIIHYKIFEATYIKMKILEYKL